ncbi:ADP-ribosylglycohydrolase family protein [Gimesia fumaroli]|uniref:ADP-ribosyl-[dinitrogen reductase] glycohydrolase n=1 Tax=Gimesia fumaroli TaxID=2527976 RepID=A0A518IHR3_9PLAN|nr:ADP-ribosylglycohydrolase family protein [Gimesia fumaroli]QDV52625.1 ADP-ribosyl-[dinitrogen reductase] glycohydrolase [Gimesia fumaroli]
MERYSNILGCILGTAVADSVGLKREGLSKQRARRLYGGPPLKQNLIWGRGLCSDDTEHTLMVGRAVVISRGDVTQFEKQFARELKRWFLCVPAGVGFATLRACLKLLVGFHPQRSGVNSAGNGPAMRSAILGVCAEDEEHLSKLVYSSTRMTHVDSRAEAGALLIAQAARQTIQGAACNPLEFLQSTVSTVQNEELQNSLRSAIQHLSVGASPERYAEAAGWGRGISGYVNQTVPAALYCWAYSPDDFRRSVENAVMLGGDTDSVAAITGAVSGANLGADAIPVEWKERLMEWPRTTAWMELLATSLSEGSLSTEALKPPSMYWLATIPRNLMFASVVLTLGFRRLLPPY